MAAAALLSLVLPKLYVMKASGSSITFVPDILEEKFDLKGIKFSDAGIVELTV